MKQAGYSGKSLIEKLGFKSGDRVQLYEAPVWFKEYLERGGITLVDRSPVWFHGFFTSHEQIATKLQFVSDVRPSTGIWVSWPKQSSGIKTDVTEQTFRDLILPLGWVDTKVAAIDETWSGLKFLRRKN